MTIDGGPLQPGRGSLFRSEAGQRPAEGTELCMRDRNGYFALTSEPTLPGETANRLYGNRSSI